AQSIARLSSRPSPAQGNAVYEPQDDRRGHARARGLLRQPAAPLKTGKTMSLRRQFSAFFLVGLIATGLQYAVLVGLKELAHWPVVPASLTGYLAGGVFNYILNRRHTFESDRPHVEAGWRFAAVMVVGF